MSKSTSIEQQNQGVHWCVVFDSRDGNVIHTHQFIGEETKEAGALEECARTALQSAKQYCDDDAMYLKVMHAPSDFRFEPGLTCRVDLASGKLITFIDPHNSLQMSRGSMAESYKKPKEVHDPHVRTLPKEAEMALAKVGVEDIVFLAAVKKDGTIRLLAPENVKQVGFSLTEPIILRSIRPITLAHYENKNPHCYLWSDGGRPESDGGPAVERFCLVWEKP